MKRHLIAVCLLIMTLLCACGKKETSSKNSIFDIAGGEGISAGYPDTDGKTVIYVVKEKYTFDSENVMTQKIQYTYDEKGNMLSEEVDNGKISEAWNEELMIYEYVFGEVDGEINYSRYWTYDKYANMLTQEKENPDGKKQLEYNFEYTYKNGLPIKQTIPNNSRDYTEYYYDTDGQLIRQLQYRLEYEEPSVYQFEYNSDGTLGKIYWDKGSVFTFSYNVQDKLTELTRTDGTGALIFRNVYKYDYEGNMIIKEMYNSDNELEQRSEYVYNRDGLLEEEKIMTVESGKEVHQTVKYAYEKVKMSDSEAENYHARSQWRWLMEQTENNYLFRK